MNRFKKIQQNLPYRQEKFPSMKTENDVNQKLLQKHTHQTNQKSMD